MSCKQKIDESVLPYAARFKNLAYDTIEPDASEAVRQAHEKQMVAQFLSGLAFSGKRFVMSKNPTKLEVTIKIAIDEECNSQLMGQDKGKGVCSAVTADETNDSAELKALFVQVLTKLDRNAPQPSGSSQFERPPPRNLPTSPASSHPVSPAPMRRRCFQCGNDRNLIANCPDLRRSEPSSSSPGWSNRSRPREVICYKCNCPGHYATDCERREQPRQFTNRYDGLLGIDFCKRFGVMYDAQNRRVMIKDRGIEVEESINSISAIDNNKKFMSVFSDEMIEVGPREERRLPIEVHINVVQKSGYYACTYVATVTITAESTCLPGIVQVSFLSIPVSTRTLQLTTESTDYDIEFKNDVKCHKEKVCLIGRSGTS
ncbi:hypothetical protein GQR58_006539 [Nymphon striatum]|nr:hypothetical protein GQR58_006539 [Nymphon striatum]